MLAIEWKLEDALAVECEEAREEEAMRLLKNMLKTSFSQQSHI